MKLATRVGPGAIPRSRLLAAAIAACVASLSLIGVRADIGGVRSVGVFPRPDGGLGIRANGELLIRGSTRRAYQAVKAVGTTVTEIDLDSLKSLRSVKLPDLQTAFTTSGETQWLWALDDVRGRVFAIAQGTDTTGQRNYSLLVLDLATLKYTRTASLWPPSERFPLGMSYHAPSDRLYMLSKVNADVFGREIPLAEERKPDGTLVWEHPLPMCLGARDYLLAPVIARSVLHPSYVYLDCYGRNLVQAQVVRISLDASGAPASDEVFPAVPKALSVMFDPGSDRILFLTTNSNAGRGAWVFDGAAGQFLGIVASGDPRPGATDYAMGLDPVRGRLYMQTPIGLILADIRRTPLGAGLLFRDFAGPGVVPLHVDPVARHVFAPDPQRINQAGQPDRYRVLLDEDPPSLKLARPDPDALTVNVLETSGVTGANFSGAARAFAARALTTGGVQRAVWNVAVPDVSPENLAAGWSAVQSIPLSGGNRDLTAGRVMNVALTGDAADASAVSATPGDASLKDLSDHGVAWPFARAECHGAGSAPASEKSETGAATVCDAPGHTASAFARAQRLNVATAAGAVVADVLSSEGRSFRDPLRGIVSRATAVVRDLDLFGRVHIGELTAVAETAAAGRPGTARATYVRQIADVSVDIEGDGKPEFTCAVCDAQALVPLFDRALGGTATVSFPTPDARFYPNGSPGGYQSVVRRDIFQSLAASSLNDDDAPEVPGFEVVVYSDGRAGRTRQVLEFAAVLAEARYGIYMLPVSSGSDTPGAPAPIRVVTLPTTGVLGVKFVARPARTTIQDIVHRVRGGLALVLASPRDGFLVGALWLFFASPVWVLARRRFAERIER